MSQGEILEFSLVKKGYDPAEVEAYIEELESKLSYYQSRTQEVEQKLQTCHRLIRRFSGMENSLRQNIADSKRAAAAMMSDTKERSDALLDKTREECGEIISRLDNQIAAKMNAVDQMKASVALFKEQLFDMYSEHIQMIEALAGSVEEFNYQPDYSPIANAVEEFEAAEEAKIVLPEFEDYPEESIFDEVARAEEKKDDFVMDTPQTVDNTEEETYTMVMPESEEAKAEVAEPELVVESLGAVPAEETFEEESFSFVDDADVSLEEVLDEIIEDTPSESDDAEDEEEYIEEEIEEEVEEEVADPHALDSAFNELMLEENSEGKEKDDYYTFLSNFINSDD